MKFSELALPAEGVSSAGRALSPAPSALKPACELMMVMMMSKTTRIMMVMAKTMTTMKTIS